MHHSLSRPREVAEEHYKDLKDKPFFPDLIGYILSGPVVGMVSPLRPVVVCCVVCCGCAACITHHVGPMMGVVGGPAAPAEPAGLAS